MFNEEETSYMKGRLNINAVPTSRLANEVGEFIAYWGFKKIHGQAWTLIYLSPKPIGAGEITATLKVSKGLVSVALKELCDFQLVRIASEPGRKVKRYVAAENVFGIIQNILSARELVLIQSAEKEHQILQDQSIRSPSKVSISSERLRSLGEMIQGARLLVEHLLQAHSLSPVGEGSPIVR